jgi:ABC-type transport system involved in multi-copper enzyme maturation permease subunit
MSVLSNIRSVAKYESKLLMRSWFYRIFLVVAVLFLCAFNFEMLIQENVSGIWMMKALASNIPYINLLLLNTGQAVIAVFLSSEFLKSDKKLDTSEVFYVHPLSNAEYVIGKIWGNIVVFFRLDLIIIALVIIFNLASGVSLDWKAYIAYFFLICVPTLIYIFGLSVGLMLIIKSQAITFVILLGYIALTLFYIGDKFYYLFDYMVYSLPLVKSTIVGFSNWTTLINHRCIYLLIGLGFICISIFLFRRLPNTKYGRYRWLALAFCFIAAGCLAGYNHVDTILDHSNMRTVYTNVNNKYVKTPKMVIDNYDIVVQQRPDAIESEVTMKGVALEQSSVFTFCLNPSLQVREIKENGKDIPFTRDHQIVLIDFGRELVAGDSALFMMKYDGPINEDFCYLDIPPEILQQEFKADELFRIDKKYSFQAPNYVLFTPETYWYPRPGTSYSNENPDWQQAYFSNFRLTVKTINGLRAFSQGTMKWPIVEKIPFVPKRRAPATDEQRSGGEMARAGRPPGGGMARSGGPGGGGMVRSGGSGGGAGRGGGAARSGGQGGASAQGGAGRGGGQGGASAQGGVGRGGGQGAQAGQPGGGGSAQAAGEERGRSDRTNAGARDSMRRSGSAEWRERSMQGDSTGIGRRDGEGRGRFDRMDAGARDSMRRSGSAEWRERSMQGDSSGIGRRGGEGRPPGGDAERAERRSPGDEESGPDLDETGTGEHISETDQPKDTTAVETEEEKKPEKPKPLRDSLYIFETDFLSPSITLIIGEYEEKYIDVDSTEYSILYLSGHDYFSSAFDSIIDTIPSLIRDRRGAIERNYSLDYAFNRFSLVEVPVQFFSYVRAWTQAQEQMQPEMVLFPEKGCMMGQADVVGMRKNQKQWAKWNGQEITDDEASMRTFTNFLWTFQRTESNFNWSNERGAMNISTQANPYLVFPQLYNFRYNVFSAEWPIANRLIELYLQNKSDNNNWMRQMNGISNNEKANLLMEKHAFKELLADTEQRDLLDNVISLKANYLFAPAERNIGFQEFRDSLRTVLQQHTFANLRFEDLLDTMSMIADEDLRTPLNAWNDPTPLPIYIVGLPEVMQISTREKEVYIVKLQITNDSDNDGVIHVDINVGGWNAVYDPRAKRKVSVAAHESKQLVSVWDEAPRSVTVNTLISANLPNMMNQPVSNIVRERNKPIPEEEDIVIQDVSYDIPGEVIVDNEDSLLFVLSKPDVVGLLPKWLDQVDDHSFRYSGVSEWRPPLEWTLTTNDKYYGTHVRSAYVIKSGAGSQTATWKIPVPAVGQYDLFYYVYRPMEVNNRRGGGRPGGGDTEYNFKVKYDGDEENAYIDVRRSNEGWSLLGTYYFNKDTVQVVLTNDCNLRSVTADAVKIVRR